MAILCEGDFAADKLSNKMAKRGGNVKSLVAAQLLPPLEFKKLFILGGGGLDEDNWRDAFSDFGNILKVNIMTDKKTGRQKGMCHILFDKTSEAALAKETLTGQHIGGDKPIKIMFAQDKRDNLEIDCDEEKMLQRIFVKCLKTQTDLDLTSEFGRFGSVENVRVLKDNSSGESRGLAFVKFSKQCDAARALEECDESYKARWADVRQGSDEEGQSSNACYNCGKTGHYSNDCPGNNTKTYTSQDPYAYNMGGGNYNGNWGADQYGGLNQGGYNNQSGGFNNQGSGFNSNFNQGGFNPPMQFGQPQGFGSSQFGQSNMRTAEPEKQGPDTVEALIPATMTDEQIKFLFSIAPGYTSHTVVKCGPSSIAKVTYKSPKCAAYAKEKIDGMDYAGEKIAVRFGKIKNKAELQKSAVELQNTLAALTAKGGADPNELVQIMQSISQVTEAIRNPESEEQDLGEEMVPWCSVALPVRKPMASFNAAVVARLFVVAIPDRFSDDLLLNAFCRFGDLVSVKFQPDKRFGFAHFANHDAAEAAKKALHGQYIANNRLKVEFTQGPKLDKGEDEPARKRGRDF